MNRRNRGSRPHFVGGAAFTALALLACAAWAEPTTAEKTLAATLFKDAKALLEGGHVAEACRKLEESQRLLPASGTLLNLAVCHEREGRTASAWEEFRESRARAERDKRADRLDLATEHMRALEPLLSKLVIEVPSAADIPDVSVLLDGRALGRAAWGTPFPVDPGEHTIAAEAPRRKRWSARVAVAPARREVVSLPRLEPESIAPEAPPDRPLVVPPPDPVVEAPEPPRVRIRAPAIVATGIGIAGIATGTYFGVLAIVRHHQAEEACTANPCSAAANSFNDASKGVADASTVAFSVGLASLGVATYLWLSRSPKAAARTAISITPTASPRRASLQLMTAF